MIRVVLFFIRRLTHALGLGLGLLSRLGLLGLLGLAVAIRLRLVTVLRLALATLATTGLLIL